jgi:hypothetical protein
MQQSTTKGERFELLNIDRGMNKPVEEVEKE